jgi:hypothetical protein
MVGGEPADTDGVPRVERRTVRLPGPPAEVRSAIRRTRRRARDGVPQWWFGAEAPPGVVGWVLGRFTILEPVPPGCTIFSRRTRRLPVVLGRIVPAGPHTCELRLRVFPPGFPIGCVPDSGALALLDAWLDGLAR